MLGEVILRCAQVVELASYQGLGDGIPRFVRSGGVGDEYHELGGGAAALGHGVAQDGADGNGSVFVEPGGFEQGLRELEREGDMKGGGAAAYLCR